MKFQSQDNASFWWGISYRYRYTIEMLILGKCHKFSTVNVYHSLAGNGEY